MTETATQQHSLDFDLDVELVNTFASKPTGDDAFVGQIYVGQVGIGQLHDRLVELGEKHWASYSEVVDRIKGQFVRALTDGTISPDAVKAAPAEIREFFGVKDD